MTESEYMAASELAKVRVARAILRDLVSDQIPYKELAKVCSTIWKWEQALSKAAEVNEGGEDA